MTPLASELVSWIKQTGPMTIAQFMALCLGHPTHGYYTRRDPLGVAGDFTTAPEISQMFGELIGLCLAESWTHQGRPPRFTLAELGPGRGTLMADILRVTRKVPGFHEALRVCLVEISPALRAAQSERLGAFSPMWLDTVAGLERIDEPLYLVANEYFDVLPIRQFARSAEGWRERVIALSDEGELAFALSPPSAPAELAHRLADTSEGDLVEWRAQAVSDGQTIAGLIEQRGGAALIIDYGDWRSRGDTLQAIAEHAYCDPLQRPGNADLTAHVEFESLARAADAAGAQHSSMLPQGTFLKRLGIDIRAQVLAQALAGKDLESHLAACRRLTAPEEMGTLFKAMAFYPRDASPPPGFSE